MRMYVSCSTVITIGNVHVCEMLQFSIHHAKIPIVFRGSYLHGRIYECIDRFLSRSLSLSLSLCINE